MSVCASFVTTVRNLLNYLKEQTVFDAVHVDYPALEKKSNIHT